MRIGLLTPERLFLRLPRHRDGRRARSVRLTAVEGFVRRHEAAGVGPSSWGFSARTGGAPDDFRRVRSWASAALARPSARTRKTMPPVNAPPTTAGGRRADTISNMASPF